MIELVEFLDHDDDFLADFRTGKSQFDKLLVFETVQDQQAVGRLLKRERGVEFGFRTSFQAEIVARALAQVFFDHGPLLVYLHRVNTHVRALVIKFADRAAERALKFSDLGGYELREAQQHGRGDSALGKVVDNLFKVRRARVAFDGSDDEISLPVYIKVASTPVFNSISFERLLDCRGQLAISCLRTMT